MKHETSDNVRHDIGNAQGNAYCATGTVNFTAYSGDTISIDIALNRSDIGASMAVTQVHIRRTAS